MENMWIGMLVLAAAIFLIVFGVKAIIKLIERIRDANYQKYINSPEYKKLQEEIEEQNRKSREASIEKDRIRVNTNSRRCNACFHQSNGSCPYDIIDRWYKDTCSNFVKE